MTAKRLRQIKKWQQAGAQATRSMPMGKTVLLYHRTSPRNVISLTRKGFEPGHLSTGQKISKAQKKWLLSIPNQNAFFIHPKMIDSWKGYGRSVVSVKVPRQFVKTDKVSIGYDLPLRKVSYANLKGRKVKLVHNA